MKTSEVSTTTCFAVRQGEILGRIDSPFYIPNITREIEGKYPVVTLRELSKRIIQPTEFIREYVEESENAVPVLRAANVEDGYLNVDDVVFVVKENLKSAKDSFIENGDILITRTGAKAGATCVVRDLKKRFCISSHSIRLIPDREKVIPEYLETFLISDSGKSQVNRLLTGAAQKQLQLASIATVKIPLPPLDVQKTLVAQMESARVMRQSKLAEAEELFENVDDVVLSKLKIDKFNEKHRAVYGIKLGKMDTRLDAYANQPRFHKLRKMLQEKYSAIEIGTIALDIFSGTTPLAGGTAYTDEVNGIPFIRSGEITSDGLVSESHEVFLKEEVHNTKMKGSQLKKDDLLIAIVGATIGSVGVYKSLKEANINQAIAAVRLPTEKLLPEYVCWYLKSSIGQGMLDFLKRPVARANINLEEIGQILIPIPSLDIQKAIIKDIEIRRTQARRLREEAESQWQSAKEKFEKALLG